MAKYKNYWGNYNHYDDFYSGYEKSKNTYGNWFNSFNDFSKDGDEKDLVCKEEGYETPKYKEINNKIPRSTSFDNYEKNLVKDLSRMFASYSDEFLKDDKELDISSKTNKEIDEITKKQEIIKEIKNKRIPGFSPLDRAINAVNSLKVNNDNVNLSGLSLEELRNSLEKMNFDEDIFFNPEIDLAAGECPYFKDESSKLSILNKIALIKRFGDKFKVKKEIFQKEILNSKEVKSVILKNLSEIYKVNPYKFSIPQFITELATKSLHINQFIETSVEKQKIILLIDESGSMNNLHVQEWVCAILIDRFRYVIKGDAEVFVHYFIEGFRESIHVKNKKDVNEFWSKIYVQNPIGGMTKIGECIEKIQEEVLFKNYFKFGVDLSYEKPEILVLHDDRDPLYTDEFNYKTNAFGLNRFHQELKDLSLKSGGKYIYVNGDEIKEYG
jgi:uncharacterized protein with von Willebrand factor type A (vWA) domain